MSFKLMTLKSKSIAIPIAASLICATFQVQEARAGDAGAFAAGAIIGGAVGAILSNANNSRKNVRRNTRRRSPARTSSAYKARRAENKKVQGTLNFLGIDVGAADGAIGRKTRAGITQFQATFGFVPTGTLTEAEKQVLLNAPLQVEQQLYLQGFQVGLVDGVVDHSTKIAISQYQSKIGQIPNGQLNPMQARRLLPAQNGFAGQPMLAEAPGNSANPVEPANTVAKQVAHAENAIGESPPASVDESLRGLPEIDPEEFFKSKVQNENAVAVIIGNRNYQNPDIPDVEYAARDAQAMKYAFTHTLGVPEENIIELPDATLATLIDTFGDQSPDGGMLWSYIDPDGLSDVYVYYSGHGIPSLSGTADTSRSEAYIAPADLSSTSSIQSSYSLKKLYANLEALPTKSVTVFIDACFSGASGDGDMLIQAASPLVIWAAAPEDTGDLNVFAAAEAAQIASWNKEKGHGIFTQHLIMGLNGKADADDDRKVSAGELGSYLEKQVRRTARRTWRREQTPTFKGQQDMVLVTY